MALGGVLRRVGGYLGGGVVGWGALPVGASFSLWILAKRPPGNQDLPEKRNFKTAVTRERPLQNRPGLAVKSPAEWAGRGPMGGGGLGRVRGYLGGGVPKGASFSLRLPANGRPQTRICRRNGSFVPRLLANGRFGADRGWA